MDPTRGAEEAPPFMDCLRSSITRFALVLLVFSASGVVRGDAPPADHAKAAAGAKSDVPLGRYLTLSGAVDDVVFGRVQNTALTLENQAKLQHRKAVLVLEIAAGSSQFHQVHGLAKFLTSVEIADVKTVAWIPETVTGNNVIVALACNEIVMHPDAELGDIGRGKALDR